VADVEDSDSVVEDAIEDFERITYQRDHVQAAPLFDLGCAK